MKTQKIRVEYIDHLGSDLMVVNAARTSFGKESAWLPSGNINDYPGVVFQQIDGHPVNLPQDDANLIRYLATGYRTSEWKDLLNSIIDVVLEILAESGTRDDCTPALTALLHAYKRRAQHWAPFAHPHLSLRMQLPMFLARQFVKHQIGGVWSEESRRYISDEPGVWFPDEWRSRPEDVKQGSGHVIGPQVFQDDLSDRAEKVAVHALNTYGEMVTAGVAPEEARIVLPLNTMTTVTWTGSLLFWSRVCNQRVDSHAQLAAQELGRKIADIVRPYYPVSWAALCGE